MMLKVDLQNAYINQVETDGDDIIFDTYKYRYTQIDDCNPEKRYIYILKQYPLSHGSLDLLCLDKLNLEIILMQKNILPIPTNKRGGIPLLYLLAGNAYDFAYDGKYLHIDHYGFKAVRDHYKFQFELFP